MHKYKSDAIVCDCGDFRTTKKTQEILNQLGMFNYNRLPMPGGSRCVSLYKTERSSIDPNLWKEMQNVFHMSFSVYLKGGATTAILIDHGDCFAWEDRNKTYKNKNEEESEHYESSIISANIIKKKYAQIKNFIIIYLKLDKNTEKVVDVKIYSFKV